MRPTTSLSLFSTSEMEVTGCDLDDGSRLTLLRRYERGTLPLYRVCHDELVVWEGLGKSMGHQRFLQALRALG